MWGVLLAAALAPAAFAQDGGSADDPAARTPAQLRQLASAALGQNDPRRALQLIDGIQPGDRDYGAAQALKARALEKMGDVQSAIAAWRQALKDPVQRGAATAHIKLLRARAAREGGGERGAPQAVPPAAATYNGLTPGDLGLIASMFRSQDASQTLAATLRKAAQGDASGMTSLRRHGIDFARGPADQREAVLVESKDGTQVVTFSPAVLDNPSRSHAIAGLANGVEQAATQRDYSGVSLWLRQWGGRLVGVLVYRQLAPREAPPPKVPEADQRLISDRIAYEYVTAKTGFPTPPLGGSGMILYARAQTNSEDPAVGFLYFCGHEAAQPLAPSSLTGSDQEYYGALQSLPR